MPHQHTLQHLNRQKKIINIRKPLFRSEWMQWLDKIAYIVGILGPLFTLPQAYNVWILQEVAGVSAFAWGSAFILDIPLLIYALAHREKLMIMIYIAWATINFLIAFGVIIYS